MGIESMKVNRSEDKDILILAKHREKSSSYDSSLIFLLQHEANDTETRVG